MLKQLGITNTHAKTNHALSDLCTTLLLILLITQAAVADTYTWTGAGDSVWIDMTRWTPNAIPKAGDDVSVYNSIVQYVFHDYSSPLESVTVDAGGEIAMTALSSNFLTDKETIGYVGIGVFSQSGGTHSITDSLTLGHVESSIGNYRLYGGDLSVNDATLGLFGRGTFTQSGGTHEAKKLTLGSESTGEGTYDLRGGTLKTSEIKTGSGHGKLAISGGTLALTTGNISVDDLVLGETAGSHGSYTHSKGSLEASFVTIGDYGTGTFTQSGEAVHEVTDMLVLGENSTGNGTYTLSGGVLAVKGTGWDYDNDRPYNDRPSGVHIGRDGTGSFYHTGGEHVITGCLYMGYGSSGAGTYELSGGELSAKSLYMTTGVFTQSGGKNTLASALCVGHWGTGTYDLSNGELSAYQETIGEYGTGTFTQSGGKNTIASTLYLGRNTGSTGTYELSNGELSVFKETIGHLGTGTFTQSGGTHSISNSLTLGYGPSITSTYDLSDGELSANDEIIGDAGTGTFTQSGGTNTVANELKIGSKGTYTLSDGTLDAGTITNNNTFTQSSGTLNADQITNNHHLTQLGGQMNVTGNVNNYGKIELGSAATFTQASGTFTNYAGATFINNGTFDNTTGTLINQGLYQGTGTIIGDVLNAEGGGMCPGNSPGLLSIDGNYTQLADAFLEAELGGLTQGLEYDVLNVTGTLNLGGTLDVVWYDGFTASLDDSFDILNWGSLNGEFDFINLPTLDTGLFWDISGLYNDGTILVTDTAAPVPVPSAVLLAVLGVGLASRVRRKQEPGCCHDSCRAH